MNIRKILLPALALLLIAPAALPQPVNPYVLTAAKITTALGYAPATSTLTNGSIFIGNSSNVATAAAMSRDCAIANTGAITCTKTNNVALGTLATQNGTFSGISSGTNTGDQTTNTLTASATNDNAPAGFLGEYPTVGSVAIGSPVSLATDTAKTITSISLTAGDWDVTAIGGFTGVASTSVTYYLVSISITNNTEDSGNDAEVRDSYPAGQLKFAVVNQMRFAVPTRRISVSGTTTVYLVEQIGFSAGTASGFGQIHARRVR